jgi:hypothetical protein
MDPIIPPPEMDSGERTLRRLARVCLVLALGWAAGGVYLMERFDPPGAVAWVGIVVAFGPLYLLYAFAGEVLGAPAARRLTAAIRIRIPPRTAEALGRRVGGPVLLLLVIPATIALAWLILGPK